MFALHIFMVYKHYNTSAKYVNYGFLLTKWDFRLQNGKFVYKVGFSITKWDSWVTNGILMLQFRVYRLLMKSEALCDIINFTDSEIGFNSHEV